MSEASAQAPAFAALERLPSETTIHVVALTAFCVLSLGVVLALDAKLAGELAGDPLPVTLLLVVALALAVGVRRYVRERRSPLRDSMFRRAIVTIVRRPPLRRVRSLRLWAAPVDYQPLDPQQRLATLAREEIGGHVTLLWAPCVSRVTARAVGSSERPTIAASAGLCGLAESDPDGTKFVLRHEAGHFHNRDLRVFAFLLALVRGWRVGVIAGTAVSVYLGWLGWLGWFASRMNIVDAFVLLVTEALLVVFLVASFILCAKYQSFVLATREAHADVHAALASTQRGGPAWRPLGLSVPAGWRRKLLGLKTVSFTHFPDHVRARLVSQPWRMAAPKALYFALVGLLLGASELNLGPHHLIAFQAPWALAWVLFAAAFVANTFRYGLFLGGQGWRMARSSALLGVAIAGGITLSLPWWRSECLDGLAPQLALSLVGHLRGAAFSTCHESRDWLSPRSWTAAALGAGCALVCTGLSAVAGKHASHRSQGYSPRAVWLGAVLAVLPTFVCLVAERWTSTSWEDLDPPRVAWLQIAVPHSRIGATRSELGGLLGETPHTIGEMGLHVCFGRPELVLVDDERLCFHDPIVVWLSNRFESPGLLLGLGALLSSAALSASRLARVKAP